MGIVNLNKGRSGTEPPQIEKYANFADFPPIGNDRKLYLDEATNIIYVWDGSAYDSTGGITSVEWGDITGDITDQTDLVDYVAEQVGNSIQTLWGYQDFAAGEITGTSVTLTENENGADAEFTPANFYNYADIYRSDNNGYVYTSGFFGLFTGLVDVSAQSGAAITLNRIPDLATPIRIWWVYYGSRPATGYIIPPQNILDSAAAIKLDTLFVADTDIGVTVEAYIEPGTVDQYWRGDKVWEDLTKEAVAGIQIDDSPEFEAIIVNNGGLRMKDYTETNEHIFYSLSDISADRQIFFYTGDQDNTIDFRWFNQAVKDNSSVTHAGLNLSGLTASQLIATDGSKNLQSLSVATYPSLTELTYVKGVTSAIQTQLNGKENVANKATDFSTVNNTLYPTVQAVKTYADGLVAGLLDDRGSYNASGNTFPASGGSGTAGAVLKGDLWYISVGGTLGGSAVTIGDSVRALVDTPGQTASNWDILSTNIGYVPENIANKSTNTSLGTSDTLYPSQNAVKVYADAKVADAINDGTTTIAPSQNAVFDALALKAASGANTDIISVYLNNTGLKIRDTDASHGLSFVPGSNLSADRVLTITTGDSNRTLTLAGDATISGTNTGDQTNIAGNAATASAWQTGRTITIGSTGKSVDGSAAVSWTLAEIGAAASGTNTDITSVYLNNTGLKIRDTNASHGLSIVPGSNITADRVLTLTTGDAARTITLSGNPTLSDWFDQEVKSTSNVNFNRITWGSNTERLVGGSTGTIIAIGDPVASASMVNGRSSSPWTNKLASYIYAENAAVGPKMFFAKSRSSIASGFTIVANNDPLGQIIFCGADGTDYESQAASFRCEVSGTPSTTSMPGRLVWGVTASGAVLPTDKLFLETDGTLRSVGSVYIGANTAPTALLHLAAGTVSVAPLKLTNQGTSILGTAEEGAFEYGTSGGIKTLSFTRSGTTREGVLVGNRGATAPATNTIGVIIDYYGTSATRVLTTPSTWFSVVGDDGNTYKIPAYS